MTTLDLHELLGRLAANKVDFVAVGAVAVAAHGYVRGTADLDLVPKPDRDNLRRLRSVLLDLKATLPTAEQRRFDPARDAPALERGQNVSLDTPIGGIDVIQRVPGLPAWEELWADAVEADLLGVPVRVASLRHLRAMKEAAGRAIDQADLENLPEV